MPWSTLADSLDLKPLVLAGPILRKVTPQSVTVWLALKKSCEVTLHIYSADGRELLTGTGTTAEIGRSLHLIAVTADTLVGPTTALGEGQIYTYDIGFRESVSGAVYSLGTATHNARLTYPGLALPSFCLPPADVNKLRVMHGSCRKPHGSGPDALAMLDDLIASTQADPYARPHQLLLTGDQIYADDVAAGLLTMITDAARVLLGWGDKDEVLPVPGVPGLKVFAHLFAPYQRNYALGLSGLTSDEIDSHLVSLGEYLCMYLFAWSGVLWAVQGDGTADLPDAEHVIANAEALRIFAPQHASAPDPDDVPKPWRTLAEDMKFQLGVWFEIGDRNERLKTFHTAIWRVRRAMANVPSYMVFDDHEITDDWNMRLSSVLAVHGSDLGRRIVQNGLVAYALCQHWGNAPEQFAGSASTSPGKRLLDLLHRGDGDSYVRYSTEIAAIIGLPTAAEIRAQRRLFHGPNSLSYHHTVHGPSHQVVMTDSRTWRSFPRGAESALIPEDVLQLQLGGPAIGAQQVLLVVLSTNAPPVRSIRTAERYDRIVNRKRHHPDLYESWKFPSDATDRLFKAISNRLPLVNGKRQGSALLLSGDVHHGFASRLLFEGRTRFEDPADRPQPVSAVFAQLVSSAFCNADDQTHGLHREGHDFNGPFPAGLTVPNGRTERLYGWNLADGEAVVVGHFYSLSDSDGTAPPTTLPRLEVVRHASGTEADILRPESVAPLETEFFVPLRDADWRYRLDYLHATAVPVQAVTPPAQAAGDAESARRDAAREHHRFASAFRQYNRTGGACQEVVGVNCISEVSFEWPAHDGKSVLHTMFWQQPGAQDPLRFTAIRVSLDASHPAFLDPDVTP